MSEDGAPPIQKGRGIVHRTFIEPWKSGTSGRNSEDILSLAGNNGMAKWDAERRVLEMCAISGAGGGRTG